MRKGGIEPPLFAKEMSSRCILDSLLYFSVAYRPRLLWYKPPYANRHDKQESLVSHVELEPKGVPA